jgi:hypothetical protein
MRAFVVLGLVLALAACGGNGPRAWLSDRGSSPDNSAPETELARIYGAVCGDPRIRGEVIAPVTSSNPGCGIAEPVKIYEVDGIALSTGATINCRTASALKTWVRDTVRPEVGKRGGGLSSLKVAASYACRTRNHQRGARISEHGKGNAIDISEFRFVDGSVITLTDGWRRSDEGAILRALHRGACGPFGTVLGPESDRFHQDHFHFDVAQHRGGPYCR